ncbi:MAG: tetratricopeptide repeat protein [Clostridia bacterium]|nr:tetratricopeptide repeat protein [Clostridia bacterium]
MAEMLFKTKGNASPSGKPRVYFTCHKDDFDQYFEQVCEYIFKSHDCAVYYTSDMNEAISDDDKVTDLESNNLFVVPVTFKLLSTPNRAMDEDIKFALDKHIPVLPLVMESGLDAIYSRTDKFGELQYLSPFSNDATEVSFDEKLKKYLESILVSDEMAKRVRAAFDAYIFLSYRKKDRKYANQLMRIIHNKPECRDIAIWYDEFLTPGESFRENIDKILADSKLFTLLVTPNLLEDHNFVMEQEYPAAIKSGIGILPAEMEETDHVSLAKKYANLPEISNPYDDETFRNRLVDTLSSLAIKSNDDDPEHNFLIGLAYLDGIDVEVNRERALELITSAADSELPEAMEKLFFMYHDGIGVKLDYRKATELAEKLMNYYSNTYGESDEKTLTWTNNLALSYRSVGKYSEAAVLSEKAYHLGVRILGEKHPKTLIYLDNLSMANAHIGKYDIALEQSEKTYQLRLEILGEKHPKSLTSLSNLATAHTYMGNYGRALELCEKSYQLRLEIYGEKHSKTFTGLSNLSTAYSNVRNYSKAIETTEKAYQLRLEALGETHPDTLNTLNNLASHYNSVGNYSKALEIGQKVYPLRYEILGEKHPDTISSLDILAEAYNALGNYASASELFGKLYRLKAERFGEKSLKTLKTLSNYALSLYKGRDYYKAFEMYFHLYEYRLELFGINNPKTLSALHSVGVLLLRLKEYGRAITVFENMYEIRLAASGESDANTVKSLINLGEAYQQASNIPKAVECFEKAYKTRLETLGADHEDTIAVKKLLDKIK